MTGKRLAIFGLFELVALALAVLATSGAEGQSRTADTVIFRYQARC
jgi:hypothetical protein